MNLQENDNLYKPDGDEKRSSEAPPKSKTEKPVSWEASEYIEHRHGPSWYAGLAAVTAAVTVIIFLATRSYISAATIIIVGIIVGVFAGHKPRQVRYEITANGLKVGGKLYPYSAYKSFSIIREGGLSSVSFLPLKRLMPPVSAYFEPAQEDKIAKALGNYLPYEDRKPDGIDRLSRRLRL